MAIPSTATSPSATVLRLETLVERRAVSIDGVAYPLLYPDQLPLVDYVVIEQLTAQYREILADPQTSQLRTSYTEDEKRALSANLDRRVRLVLDAPDTVHATLTDLQRMEIYRTFQQLPILGGETAATTDPAATTTSTGRSSGGRSSRASSGTTAAIPSRGTRRSRSRSSERT